MKKKKYDRKGRKYELTEVLQHVENTNNAGRKRIDFDGDMVNVKSQRLFCFKDKGIKCTCCGIEGAYFVKEKTAGVDELYHFNLYALDENGEEVLMTKDHIVPKSKGGKNHIDNYQTMCVECNERKANN